MKKGRFKIYFCTFSIIFALVFFAFGFYKIKDGWTDNSVNEAISPKTSSESNNFITEVQNFNCKSTFDFFVNESTISKTKTIFGKTTIFSVSFDLFVTNTTLDDSTLNLDAFSVNYDIGETGSFYSLEYDKTDNMLKVQSKETGSVNFVLKYIITDTENFKDYKNNNLTVKYMSTEIISIEV